MARPTYPSPLVKFDLQKETLKQKIEQTLQTVSYVDAKTTE
jgi:hypothetical protein